MGEIYKFKKKYLDKLSPHYLAVKKFGGEKFVDATHPLGAQAESAYDQAQQSEADLKQAEEDAATGKGVIPMPDEEEIARTKRRRNARMRGSRDSTALAQDEGFGG